MKKRAKKISNAAPDLLAAAFRAQADGVFIGDAKPTPQGLTIAFANESFCAMCNRSAAELAGQPHGLLHVDPADVVKVASWLKTGRPTRPLAGEGYLARKDGGTVYAAWSFSPVRTRRGRVSHIVATYRDTTEKRRLQEALVHSQRLDAVGRLAGGVAHDFNNLLSIINGYCEMLAPEVADRPQALREVEEIHKSGLRAATLTRQLLAFGRRQRMDAHIINFNRLVHEHVEILRKLVGTAGKLDIDLAKTLGNVRADPSQFQQVLLNLVINARDALRDRGCITISTSNRKIKPGHNRRATDVPPGHYVCLSVSDNGTGMDADTQKHLFEPFYTTKTESKGTGLGLALVYGVVQQSSGYINVRSAPLAGSTFEILLPKTGEPEKSAAPAAVTPLPATRGHETLLLIEDDEVVRKMVAGMLTADGYHVLAASSAVEARSLADENDRPVELLIASLESGGEALARKLKKNFSSLRVLCIGGPERMPAISWLPSSSQASLAKPFALSEILRRVRALLDA